MVFENAAFAKQPTQDDALYDEITSAVAQGPHAGGDGLPGPIMQETAYLEPGAEVFTQGLAHVGSDTGVSLSALESGAVGAVYESMALGQGGAIADAGYDMPDMPATSQQQPAHRSAENPAGFGFDPAYEEVEAALEPAASATYVSTVCASPSPPLPASSVHRKRSEVGGCIPATLPWQALQSFACRRPALTKTTHCLFVLQVR